MKEPARAMQRGPRVHLKSNGGDDGISQYDKGDVPVPAMPAATFVAVKAKFTLRGLEPFLKLPLSYNTTKAID